MKAERFQKFLEEKNDAIYQAAFDLACAIASKEAEAEDVPLEWDMSFIGEIADAAEAVLKNAGLRVCYPYLEGNDETPCPMGKDCSTKDCPFREN